MKVYRYGLSNTIEAIEESLANALNTNNKKDKARYIGEAYGMVKAIDYIFYDEFDDDECSKDTTKAKNASKKSNND